MPNANFLQKGNARVFYRATETGFLKPDDMEISGLTSETYFEGSQISGKDGPVAAFAGDGQSPEVPVSLLEITKYILGLLYSSEVDASSTSSADPTAGTLTGGAVPGSRRKAYQLVISPQVEVNGVLYSDPTTNPFAIEIYKAVVMTPLSLILSTGSANSVPCTFKGLWDETKAGKNKYWRMGPVVLNANET